MNVPIYNTVRYNSRQTASWSGRVILEMNSGHKNKKICFYPKFLLSFLWISCVVEKKLRSALNKLNATNLIPTCRLDRVLYATQMGDCSAVHKQSLHHGAILLQAMELSLSKS